MTNTDKERADFDVLWKNSTYRHILYSEALMIYLAGREAERAEAVTDAEPVKLQFPTMLRKMWSGQEVQAWLDKLPTMYAHPPQSEPSPDAEALRALLTKVRDGGLIYWEPNTERGRVNKALMLQEIEATLNKPEAK